MVAEMSEQPPRKRGRPPEDRFLRQREIFEAVLPLLKRRGARGLTMRDAAAASCMSVGGLNHYFPTKPDLLFWPLLPAACEAASQDFAKQYQFLRERDPEAFFDGFLKSTVGAIVTYCTPSIQAAVELGAKEFWDVMHGGMTPGPLIALFEETRGSIPPLERDRLTRGIRREFIGATLDPRLSREELLADVWRQLHGVRGRADVQASRVGCPPTLLAHPGAPTG